MAVMFMAHSCGDRGFCAVPELPDSGRVYPPPAGQRTGDTAAYGCWRFL